MLASEAYVKKGAFALFIDNDTVVGHEASYVFDFPIGIGRDQYPRNGIHFACIEPVPFFYYFLVQFVMDYQPLETQPAFCFTVNDRHTGD